MMIASATMPQLEDVAGRKINYLRVSLTKRCNFRCRYCYSGDKSACRPSPDLSNDELVLLIQAFARLGVDKVRLTGGEPLLRPGITQIALSISQTPGVHLIGITTNGSLLKERLNPLIEAGVNRMNISLDSLSPEVFRAITGSNSLHQVLNAVEEALDAGVFPRLKVNTVVMRGVNDAEIPAFGRWALTRNLDLRFIEYMPLQKGEWGIARFMPESEIRNRLHLPLVPDPEVSDIHSPARTYKVEGYPGRISFISAVSRRFCRTCNRLRLTSDGRLIGCLFKRESIDLKSLLIRNTSTEELALRIRLLIRDSRLAPNAAEKGESGYRPSMMAIGG
jgi:cyclic pyranopterin phosphate synthase